MPLAYWSCIETLTAIICACLPDSRFFFSRLVPQLYRSLASSVHKSDKSPGISGMSWNLDESDTPLSSRQDKKNNLKSTRGLTETDIEDEGMTSITVTITAKTL
jgi:hypothetical protein